MRTDFWEFLFSGHKGWATEILGKVSSLPDLMWKLLWSLWEYPQESRFPPPCMNCQKSTLWPLYNCQKSTELSKVNVVAIVHSKFSRELTCGEFLPESRLLSPLRPYQRRACRGDIWMSHVSLMNEAWLIYSECEAADVLLPTDERVVSRIWICHVSLIDESCLTYSESRHTYECGMSPFWMSHVTHVNESRLTYEWVMSHMWMRHVMLTVLTREPLFFVGYGYQWVWGSWRFAACWCVPADCPLWSGCPLGICTSVNGYTHLYSYVYIYIYMYVYTYMNMYIYIYIYVYTCIYMYIYIYMCIYIYIHVYVYISIHIYAYIHAYIYIYT